MARSSASFSFGSAKWRRVSDVKSLELALGCRSWKMQDDQVISFIISSFFRPLSVIS